MDQLLRKRQHGHAKLNRIIAYIEQNDNVNQADIHIRLESLSDIWTEFDTVQTQIECSCLDSELANQQNEQEIFETKFYSTKAKLITIIESKSASTSSATSNENKQATVKLEQQLQIRLPVIELPNFSGEYQQWASFNDIFVSVIHNNESLSPSQKLHYLKSSIKGEAARLLSSVSITDANYSEAWAILKNRFSNRRQIIQAHLRTLHAQPKITNEAPREIRKLLDVTIENLRALRAMGLPTEKWDHLTSFLITERLDPGSRRQWELSIADNDDPSFEDLQQFLERRCRALEAAPVTADRKPLYTPKPSNTYNNKQPQGALTYHVVANNCTKCKAMHPLYRCEEFIQLTVPERIEFVKKSGLCTNCLRHGHLVRHCRSSSCKECGQYHNSLLHEEEKTVNEDNDVTIANHHAGGSSKQNGQVLLATSTIEILDQHGNWQRARALLDAGSQASFITEGCVQRLAIKREKSDTVITGLGSSKLTQSRGKVTLKLISRDRTIEYNTDAFILGRITEKMPTHQLNSETVQKINRHNLDLADPEFWKPAHIDLLVGAELCYDMLLKGKIKDDSNLTLQNTTMGWIVAGATYMNSKQQHITSHLIIEDLSLQLQRFWEIEEVPQIQHLTQEESQCEKHFETTYTRTESGRFVVDLPFNSNVNNIGNTYTMAKKRLLQLEKRLEANPSHKLEYNKFMNEYITLGHMELSKPNTSKFIYHLPHHYVLREQSISTKLRVVFDGSVNPTSGVSLNQAMLVGPTIQNDLITILTRFRIHNIVFTADISKMYRQILVSDSSQNYQHILWRFNSHQNIEEYTLKTVTYGTAAAPFLAVKSLMELANTGKAQYPLASEVVRQDFYVDDVMTGADTITQALLLQNQLVELLRSGGFELHKWKSNCQEISKNTCYKNVDDKVYLEFENNSTKNLGIHWEPTNDRFTFQLNHQESTVITKRTILSETSKLFDPLGWLAPIIITAKLFMQELWLMNSGWDEELPLDITRKWTLYKSRLAAITDITIPRQMITDSKIKYQIHGFSDASEKAYGAVLYIRSYTHHQWLTRIVCAKSRVAPLKQISLPRLELCGAVLMSKLINTFTSILNITMQDTFTWTDSTVVLSWLSKSPRHWKTFVGNRVSQIQQLIHPTCWKHIKSEDNPADCLSRGLTPSELKNYTLWWNGPSWLKLDESSWPRSNPLISAETSHNYEARAPQGTCLLIHSLDMKLNTKFSSWTKLIRITAYCLRFIENCKTKTRSASIYLSSEEYINAELHWIRQSQLESFSQEILNCKQFKPLSQESPLRSLNPFVDDQDILRVGGRIERAIASYDLRHPIILSHNHVTTNLIICAYHLRYLHAGPQLLLSVIRQRYWIVKAKQIIRSLVHKCVVCTRNRAQTSQQLMGSLPRHRLEPAKAFVRCGIDYAGPISIKTHNGRRNKSLKAYICIIVCFVTRATHLELVGDLSTQSFLGALRRFISRRGIPSDIYTDCGTNFIGAKNHLRELHQFLSSNGYNQQLSSTLNQQGIKWHNIPPSAPHFGGLWEAGVRSTKYHLRRTVGLTILTYEEFNTLLIQVECCLNSRPLCPISPDPEELMPLTPGHFLIGESLASLPDPNYLQSKLSHLDRWQLIQRMLQQFWKCWTSEYLAHLQQRPKWCLPKSNLKEGDLVIVKGDNTSPLQWPMARVIQTHPGSDKLVRTVTLKTTKGVITRPVTKCCMLPIDNESSD